LLHLAGSSILLYLIDDARSNKNQDSRKLGVKRWRTKALDREEWASIIKEAKAKLKGPYCYRRKKITLT